MKFFTESLLNYLKNVCHPILKQPETRELRVFLSSLPPTIVEAVARDLSDYWLKSKRTIDFQFKVGHKLWRQWERAGADRELLERIKAGNWVDLEDRLTHYRNMEWLPDSGTDGLVVMLVGVEQATDQGSLEDFFRVDVDTVWREQMNRRFWRWLDPFLSEKQINPERPHLEQMEELLETLRRHATGDLIRVSDFLDWIDFSGVTTSQKAVETLYGNLSFWGLPYLSEMRSGKWKRYVDAAIDFFSYQKFFKENERNKAMEKVEGFRERPDEARKVYDFRNTFADEDDLLDCLNTYLEYNDTDAKKRLRNFDFAVIKDDILNYKPDAPDPDPEPDEEDKEVEPPKGFKRYEGSPLEVILTALWQVLLDFRSRCLSKKKKKVRPVDVLRRIHLKGLKFIDFEDDNVELARGLLGGLDAFLKNQIETITLDPNQPEKSVPIISELLDTDKLPFGKTKSEDPNFQFEIEFEAEPKNLGVRRKFKWALPETAAYRNLWELARIVVESEKSGFWLPVFHIRYYRELFFAPDETEIHRVLRAGLSETRITNLLSKTDAINTAKLNRAGFTELSRAYADFLASFVMEGYFTAVRNHWLTGARLFYKYETVAERLIRENEFQEFRPIFYKAFLLTEKPTPEEEGNFPWAPFVTSAVVSGLHPALLDMLNHRETFLARAWLERAEFFLQDDEIKATENTWHDVRDLATISYPLFGIVSKPSGVLDTRVTSLGHLHRLGKPEAKSGPLSSKILQQYETPDDDDIKDATLFRETRESREISRILSRYARVYPHANDGLSLAVLNPANIQVIIAGVDGFLEKKLKKDRAEDADAYPPYHFSLSLFMHVTESGEVSRWIEEWRKRWDSAYGASRYEYYQNCRLSVSQKVITDISDYLVLLQSGHPDIDVAVLTRFMDAETQHRNFDKTYPHKPDLEFPLKFPILEIPRCEDTRHSYQNRRTRIISNRRFRLATRHSELSVRLGNLNAHPPAQEHIILSQGDFTPWAKVVDRMHKNAAWVLCLDPSVDERLVRKGGEGTAETEKREIIGFSSGVGAHGELNYTLSTERASLLDVQRMIQKEVNKLFGPWELADAEKAARLLVREARRLSGLALIRATGKGEQIQDLAAYALVRHSLPVYGGTKTRLCDELVVLDSFQHWFESIGGGREMYPDLLWLEAFLGDDRRVEVNAHLIECKISNDVNRHIHKARMQLESGLRHLLRRFMPKQPEIGPSDAPLGSRGQGFRFNQRYWWAQLQRLIANKAVVETDLLEKATAALEFLGEGHFQINWNAAALTIWTEPSLSERRDIFTRKDEWHFQEGECDITIPVIACGGELILEIGRTGRPMELPLNRAADCEVTVPPNFDGTPDDEVIPDPAHKPERFEPSQNAVETGGRFAAPGWNGDMEVSPEDEPPPSEPPTEFEVADDRKEDEAPESETEPISIVEPKVPERIFLGKTGENREVFWEFGHPELTNRHLLIFGKSGVGKTYAIQALLMEMGLSGQNAVIIDYTNGFLPDHLEPIFIQRLRPKTHLVRQHPLPINPFRKQEQRIAGFPAIEEDSHTVGGRVATVINSVYSNVGEQQRAILIETIAEGLNKEGGDFRFPALLERLKEQGTSGVSLANKLSPLVHMKLFGQDETGSWERLFSDRRSLANILQLAGVSRDIARIATEFILWDLYDFATNSGGKDRPLPIVLDEIQNLDHRLEAPLGKFLTEGRKFGLSLILATQTLSNLKLDERDRLFQASHKLFFRPAETEVKEYAKILEQGSEIKTDTWISRLNKLNKGECYSLGPALNLGKGELENQIYKIKISALPDRINRTSENE